MLYYRGTILLLLLTLIVMSLCNQIDEDVIMAPKKRPFCNAFTGCGGGKRSSGPVMDILNQQQRSRIPEDEYIPVLDTNPGYEEIARRLLEDARLFQALQEANDFYKRKMYIRNAQ